MSEVTVFVDDAVRGTLPGVCAIDGVPTSDRLTMRCPVGDGARLGVAWLLLLAGPIGWIALLFIGASRSGGGEVLTVELPLSRVAYDRDLASAGSARNAVLAVGSGILAVVLSVFVAATVSSFFVVVGVVLVLAGLLAGLVIELLRQRHRVGVRLDASRRWVTLSNVNPSFVSACHDQQEHQHR